jgi:hypothetical protein
MRDQPATISGTKITGQNKCWRWIYRYKRAVCDRLALRTLTQRAAIAYGCLGAAAARCATTTVVLLALHERTRQIAR